MWIRRICAKLIPERWKSFFRFIRDDPSRKERIPFRKKLDLWRAGFYANRCYYYDLEKKDRRLYVSDYYNLLTHPKNGRYTTLIDNKLYLPIYLHNFADHVPQYYFLLLSGRALKLYGDRTAVSVNSDEFWNSFIRMVEERGCVGKPTGGSCGEGVIIFECRAGVLFANNRPHTREEILHRLGGQTDYLICEYVRQHSYAASLSPNTTNTVRLLTCWDSSTNAPFVARGFHRIGRPTMYGADNGALGGLITFIDITTGTLGSIACIRKGWVEKVNEHPDSGVPVHGTRIPRFESIVSTVLQMCYELNYIPYIGWDIVVTEDSFKVLELNSNTDMYGFQLFEPLLSDARLLEFYRGRRTRENEKYFMR